MISKQRNSDHITHPKGWGTRAMEEYNYGFYRREKGWYSFDGEYFYPPGGPADYPIMMSMVVGR